MDQEYNIYALVSIVLLISFLGFLLENMWLAVTKGYIDNRNMTLPFLLGYGVLVLGVYFILGTPQKMVLFGRWELDGENRLLYFLLAMNLVSIAEICLGTLVETKFGFEYWNYEWIPMHITKYTSLPTSMGFGAVISGFMEYVFPEAMVLIERMDSPMMHVPCIILAGACVMDCGASFVQMYTKKKMNLRWRIGRIKENGELGIELRA